MKIITHLLAGLLPVLFVGVGWAAAIDVNTATAKQLAEAMKGIGPNKAGAIVLYRQQHGPFGRVEDLTRVRGIGKKTIEINQGIISVTGDAGADNQPVVH